MRLSKQTEKEVLQVYDIWLHSYLNGDVATYDSYFDDDYHFIGSTDNEEFLSRKDTTKFFEKTSDQLAGKCDLRKETRILEKFGELVFITHVFDAWFLNGADYSYYGRFRFTNILHKNKDGWRFIYQHFSTPDSKTEEGETIGFDKVHAENQELREAIKRRTIELEKKNQELEKTLHDLRLTQKQLIQSEKMASLGELTAGIAHEIQNPLNFVNNFSEVSYELLDEMNEELENGDLDEVKAIAHDLKLNLKKINHHGQRADAIVKGMLQHSRKSAGEKTPTDINKLADEYLRLAYHGLRAKDKSFNAALHTDFDPMLEPIMIIPQDIGRVLLNLITNAFHACAERSRSTVPEKKKSNDTDYQPAVTISTRKFTDHITIAVKDNGNGIPQQVLDKIFQPFFTTKPTGEGTGLGLSLSYDIIKAHEGKLEVETEEGAHTIFRIILPNKK